MTTEIGSFSKGSTGNTTVLLNNIGIPDELQFKVSKKVGGDTQNHISQGTVNGNLDMEFSSNASSGSTHITDDGTTKVIRHYERSGSNWVIKVEFSVTDIDDGEFDCNFTQADANYSIKVISRVP